MLEIIVYDYKIEEKKKKRNELVLVVAAYMDSVTYCEIINYNYEFFLIFFFWFFSCFFFFLIINLIKKLYNKQNN